MGVAPSHKGTFAICSEQDIVASRKIVREVCREIDFGLTDVTRIVTAASELARNIIRYAGHGEMHWAILDDGRNRGIEVTFEDHGPGIEDLDLAVSKGFSTGRSLGMGLPGARKLMDEMEIESTPGEGTVVVIRRWRK